MTLPDGSHETVHTVARTLSWEALSVVYAYVAVESVGVGSVGTANVELEIGRVAIGDVEADATDSGGDAGVAGVGAESVAVAAVGESVVPPAVGGMLSYFVVVVGDPLSLG